MKKHVFAALCALSALFIFLCVSFMRDSAPTYDEAVHLSAGYSYWKTGEIRLNMKDHPPLIKKLCALPLLAMNLNFPTQLPSYRMNLQYDFADIFVYWNTVKAGILINAARFMNVLAGLGLAWMVFFWSRDLYGPWAGALSFALFALNPNIIANSSLITTDAGVALGYFVTVYCWYRFTRSPRWSAALLAGVGLGVCLMSKFSGIVIFPVLGALIAYYVFFEKPRISELAWLKYAALCAAGFAVIFLISYGFSQADKYIEGLNVTFTRLEQGRSAFLCGEYSVSGWKRYFFMTFILKNPEIFLAALAALAAGLAYRSVRDKKYLNTELVFLIFPALFFFLTASVSRVQIGHRHILPIYPFLMVWAGSIVPLCARFSFGKWLIAAGLGLYALTAQLWYPHYLSYFNLASGGPSGAYRYLVDSNLDWGQGLKNLGAYLKREGTTNIYFSYFGSADPHYYGIRYIPVGFYSTLTREGDNIDMSREPRQLMAISATNLQSNYYADKRTFDYFKSITPIAVIDYAIFVYDITRDAAAHETLKKIGGHNTN